MVSNPDRLLDDYLRAGAARVAVHWEVSPHLDRLLQHVREAGAKAGVAVNPATPVELLGDVLHRLDYVLLMSVNPGFGAQKFIPYTLHKMRQLAEMRRQRDRHYRIEVDGGVALATAPDVVRAGAEILVAGNAVFGNGDPRQNAQALLKVATEAAMLKV